MKMNPNQMLANAISVAASHHVLQTDKGGMPYILHPIRMMQRLRTDDLELMTIAVLHDVVEDTTISLHWLKEIGFSDRVLAGVEALTKRDGESYEGFIIRIGLNRDAVLVKIEDLRDNSDITRLKGVTQKDFDRMAKYHRAFLFLNDSLK